MPLTILIADDFPDSVEALAMFLELDGHTVIKARDGLEALRLLRDHQPQLAFVDIGMPKLNGHDVARCVRDEPWSKGMTLVAMSGYVAGPDEAIARRAGFDRFLRKPVAVEEFTAIALEIEARGLRTP